MDEISWSGFQLQYSILLKPKTIYLSCLKFCVKQDIYNKVQLHNLYCYLFIARWSPNSFVYCIILYFFLQMLFSYFNPYNWYILMKFHFIPRKSNYTFFLTTLHMLIFKMGWFSFWWQKPNFWDIMIGFALLRVNWQKINRRGSRFLSLNIVISISY
jgi:hypothetical protein